ncbi:hypothetical protein QWY85_20720 [Neolewinella lacunae]|uniref:Uncharacterized protein n=1 Tax=Neolewinella lacunae TaxID=1517758 RepID=A0A923PFI5_9BACT|nr:hypothetical protein [Neolewinella lacunae]MBC6993188.1 hypothetical protein [Neolewinella lacunae]MDN3637107.1 hypothetical protein [Neolewinella lacunae]
MPSAWRGGWAGLPLLLIPFLAPACAPSPPAAAAAPLPPRPLVLLTDSTQWAAGALGNYRAKLEKEGYRVLVSGYPGETPAALVARLPWLLQPGVDRFVYDVRLSGAAGADSLRQALERLGHPAELDLLAD